MAITSSRRSGPLSRAEQQRATRAALIRAAREVFARDGYHGANLDRIATEAGFSKGAVYSNFASKAELFLAVMDDDLDHLRGEDWDPLQPFEVRDHGKIHAADAMRGFALATLEFVAAAARSEDLADALRQRVQLLLDAYGRVAADGRADEEHLEEDQLGALLAALDQGVALLVISGMASVDGALLRTGLRRLLQPPADGTVEEPADEDPRTT
jgi:AcrR family transcriptional regulator